MYVHWCSRCIEQFLDQIPAPEQSRACRFLGYDGIANLIDSLRELKLTEEEEQLILKKREEEALKKQAREKALRRIRTAHGYAIWLEANGAGDIYSTFCDEFGYEAGLGESRIETWHTINDIRKIVGLL